MNAPQVPDAWPGHFFTVDVEEYFHPTALESAYPYEAWEGLPRRSPAIMERVLETLETAGVRATFFVLGWLAEREPEMVRGFVRAGHEVASHGWRHRLVTRLSRDEFRESLRRSKQVLEDLTGERVRGYRAPSFSIVPGGEWAFDILLEEGYEYDSSLVPVTFHPTYGYPDAPREPHRIERPAGAIVEVPITTIRLLGRDVPMAGGAYFRFGTYGLLRRTYREAERRGVPGVFYIHPWELDPAPPRLPVSPAARLRTQWSTGDSGRKLSRLLGEFRFGRMDRALELPRGKGAAA